MIYGDSFEKNDWQKYYGKRDKLWKRDNRRGLKLRNKAFKEQLKRDQEKLEQFNLFGGTDEVITSKSFCNSSKR